MNSYLIVAEEIGWRIVQGHLPPGTQLKDEIDGAQEIGVSRGIYREALQHLTNKGLISRERRLGTHVRPRSEWHLFDHEVIAWTATAPSSKRLLAEMTGIIAALTADAAEIAAKKRSRQQLADLAVAVEKVASRAPVEGFETANHYFFELIYQAADNEALASLTKLVGSAVAVLYSSHSVFSYPPEIETYYLVLEALRKSNATNARKHMHRLVRSTLQPILDV